MTHYNLYGYLAIGFVFGILVLIVILLVVLIKQSYKSKNLRMMNASDNARDAEYRILTESLQKNFQEGQEKVAAELAQLRTRVASIEKLLREVE